MKLRKALAYVLILTMLVAVAPQNAFATDVERVYVGGCVMGITLDVDGVAVVGEDSEGILLSGDVIKKVAGVSVNTVEELKNAIQRSNGEVEIFLLRDGEEIFVTKSATLVNGVYTLGITVRDEVRGIGTLTYVKENGDFVALGHRISQGKSKTPVDIVGGRVTSALVIGVNKGDKSTAGELKAVFTESGLSGNVSVNSPFGISGRLEKTYQSPLYSSLVEIAGAKDVKLGKATILSTVDGKTVEEYEIEIVTKSNQTKRSEKGLVIKITDKRLLEKTGGIVQGMSGSPIMQDGKLIGAVTHVFLNDPTRGFGIFAEYLSE